jgi:hypothetical protein
VEVHGCPDAVLPHRSLRCRLAKLIHNRHEVSALPSFDAR